MFFVKRLQIFFGLSLLVIFIASCSSMGGLKSYTDTVKPTAKIAGTQIKKLAMDQVDLDVELEIDNPNPIAIDMSGFTYEVFVNDKLFTKGEQTQKNTIAAASVSKTSFPVTLVYSELKKVFKDVKNLNEINYKIKTQVNVDLPVVGTIPVNAADTGKLPIPKIPKISVSNIKLGKMDFKTADVMLTLDVENPNIFDIDITSLIYDINVAGITWVKSSLKKPVELKNAAHSKVDIPITINIWDVGGSVLESLTKQKPLSYNVTGNMAVNTDLPLFQDIKLPFDYSASVN